MMLYQAVIGLPGKRVPLVGLFTMLLAVPATACIEFNGPLQQGSYLSGKIAPGAKASLNGEALDVMSDGTVFVGFDRDAPATATLKIEGQAVCEQTLAVAAREYDIQRVEGVPAETVNPPAEQLARIQREGALVYQARAQTLARPDLVTAVQAGFVWPVEGPISGVYGSQRYYNGEPKRPHYGVDVAVPKGTLVRAPADGRITLAEPDLFFSGGTIILDHGYRLSSSFLHLSEVSVAAGTEVKAGDVIGAVGATGRATGPHLDWRMNWRDRRIDPQLLAPPMPKP